MYHVGVQSWKPPLHLPLVYMLHRSIICFQLCALQSTLAEEHHRTTLLNCWAANSCGSVVMKYLAGIDFMNK